MLDKTLGYILCCQSPGLFLAAAVLVIAYFAGRKKHRFKATLKLLLGIVCAGGGVVLYYMGMYDEYFTIRDFYRIRPAGWVGFGIVAFLTLLALVLNVLSAMGTVTMGNVLFAVLIVVLLVKPSGLLGKYVPEKV